MSKLGWYWHRFRAMDKDEVFFRLREKSLKLTESWQLESILNLTLSHEPRKNIELPSPSEAPEELKSILESDARRLLAGEWNLYGWRNVDVPIPPSWHTDYIKRVNLAGRDHLNHRALPDGADVRNIWEINRWAEVVRLGMHGLVNSDASAFQTGLDWLHDWVKNNPTGKGLNWSSPLEAGLRLINFCWFDAMFCQYAETHPDEAISIRVQLIRDKVVPMHAWWVKRYLSFGSSANNHRLGELTGLLMAVSRWPEVEKISGSISWLQQEVSDCVLTQFAEDGGSKEQALHYHLFAFELGWLALSLGADNEKMKSRLQAAAQYFVKLSHGKEPWDFGDSDDAQIVPFTLHRSDASSEWQDWMKGKNGALSYWLGKSPRTSTSEQDWWIAQDSGMAIGDFDGWKLRMDASPLGFGSMAAHGHADALHVSLWDGDLALIIDPGTGGYYADEKLRNELADWSAHNAPQSDDGFTLPKRAGCFLWDGKHADPALKVLSTGVVGTLEHEGSNISREIQINTGAGVAIHDKIHGSKCLRSRWHFSPECKIQLENNEVFIARDGKQWVMHFMPADTRLIVATGIASRHYGMGETCAVVEVSNKDDVLIRLRRVSIDQRN